MIEIPGPIPIRIHPFFWLFAFLIGFMSSGTLTGSLIWVGIIFFSVLIHELGHALTAIFFKQKANIQLVALGGLTSFNGSNLKFWQQFLITLNGPLFGFFLFLGSTMLLQFSFPPFILQILKMTQIANLFWTVVNLLPVLPLDGGQLLRIVLEASFGVNGFKASLLIGAILSALFSFYFFTIQAFLVGAFFFLFAFQSFDSWRKSRIATREDRQEENKELMLKAQEALEAGRKEEAKQYLMTLMEKAGSGVLGMSAQEYLGFLEYQEGNAKRAYELFLPIQKHLSDASLCILHQLAVREKNYPLVIELSALCYQMKSTQKIALDNARAFAFKHQAKQAGGWLQTAWQFGGLPLEQILQEEEFLKLKADPEFKKFIEELK